MFILRSLVPSVYESEIKYDSSNQLRFTIVCIFNNKEHYENVINKIEYTDQHDKKHVIPGTLFQALAKKYPYFQRKIYHGKDTTEVHIPIPQLFGSNNGNMNMKKIWITITEGLNNRIVSCSIHIQSFYLKPNYEYINSIPILRQIGNKNGFEIPNINFCAVITHEGQYMDSFTKSDLSNIRMDENGILHVNTRDSYNNCLIEIYQLENREPESEFNYLYPIIFMAGLIYYILK